MEMIGSYEAKTHFAQLIDRVVQGEQITISRNGMPVAILQPIAFDARPHPADTIAQMKKFREKHTLGGLSLREMIEEGRR